MMSNITIRVDDDLRKQADELFSDLGLNMSSAINVFLRQAVRQQGIPFPLSREIPNAETLAAMEDVRNRRNLSGPFTTVSDLMEALDADD